MHTPFFFAEINRPTVNGDSLLVPAKSPLVIPWFRSASIANTNAKNKRNIRKIDIAKQLDCLLWTASQTASGVTESNPNFRLDITSDSDLLCELELRCDAETQISVLSFLKHVSSCMELSGIFFDKLWYYSILVLVCKSSNKSSMASNSITMQK